MNGYNQKTYACKTKRYVQTLDLRDDPDMIKEYRKWHSEAFVARLQGCCADARSDEKWQMMERMFYLYE